MESSATALRERFSRNKRISTTHYETSQRPTAMKKSGNQYKKLHGPSPLSVASSSDVWLVPTSPTSSIALSLVLHQPQELPAHPLGQLHPPHHRTALCSEAWNRCHSNLLDNNNAG
eukprot:TRINITY_DN63388_c0_g2_i1.p4 TRINITY_DN63388_c0_g2~~TRINITY_DN63388_c0_g2_i1.p4  ORF type:complete len:116 (-),score=8.01 TRINITY_DN63388_c0_g2_i1:1602-1949(-)